MYKKNLIFIIILEYNIILCTLISNSEHVKYIFNLEYKIYTSSKKYLL